MNAETENPFVHYHEMFTQRDPEQLQVIGRIKRFVDTYSGIKEFRDSLAAQPDDADAIAGAYGIDLEMEQLRPFWRSGLPQDNPCELLENSELGSLWTKWTSDLIRFRDLVRTHGANCAQPAFRAWRNRQIARCDRELGDLNKVMVHPTLAFELSKGCSVGCWFCGLKSESFKGYFARTPENIRLWRETLEVFTTFLGPSVQTGVCYWGTEPTDNPSYLDFMDDFRHATGVHPQTTTACPIKDIAWTKRLIEVQQANRQIPCRFSILSAATLTEIHRVFTPDELLGFEFVQQHPGANTKMATAGRLLAKAAAAGENGEGTGTIACVSGFLVNMLDQTIELISPCAASARWPAGYRTHARGTFSGAADLESWLHRTQKECMPLRPVPTAPLRFRTGLLFEPAEDGFSLTQGNFRVHLKGGSHARIGRLIDRGTMTSDAIISALIGEVDFFSLSGGIQLLFDQGLLDDGVEAAPFHAGADE